MADKKTEAKANAEESFEKSILKLEELVQALEKGELPLEEAMEVYEQGVKLTILLNHRLKDAKLKIEELKGQKNET